MSKAVLGADATAISMTSEVHPRHANLFASIRVLLNRSLQPLPRPKSANSCLEPLYTESVLSADKSERYFQLVEARKACTACAGLSNPSTFHEGEFDSAQIGPWSRWQGNLNAAVMIVGQDWG